MSEEKFVPLVTTNEEAQKIIDDIQKGKRKIVPELDNDGKLVGVVIETAKNENLHPVTGLPILHD